jgi:hypothetical protein
MKEQQEKYHVVNIATQNFESSWFTQSNFAPKLPLGDSY